MHPSAHEPHDDAALLQPHRPARYLPPHRRSDIHQDQASSPPPSTASWFHFAPKLQPARNSNKRAREPKLNELGSKHLHLTHDVPLAGNVDNRAREPDPNELSGTTSTSRDVPLVGNIDKRAREPAPNELGWNNLHLTHAMCRWTPTSTSGLVSPPRTEGVRRDLAAGRQRPGS